MVVNIFIKLDEMSDIVFYGLVLKVGVILVIYFFKVVGFFFVILVKWDMFGLLINGYFLLVSLYIFKILFVFFLLKLIILIK